MPEGQGPSLGDASIVVSGGRGLRSAENFQLVEDLTQALGLRSGRPVRSRTPVGARTPIRWVRRGAQYSRSST